MGVIFQSLGRTIIAGVVLVGSGATQPRQAQHHHHRLVHGLKT